MARVASPRDRRNVTVLFVDIVGSTALIEKSDAELVHRLFTPAIKAMSAEVERFAGHVSKVMGDGLMAIFGVPYTLEDHATRAARAALAIQERIGEYRSGIQKKYGLDFQVRVGLNSGSVVVSVAGEGDSENFDAVGSPVHLASRIESHTPAGGIGLSTRTCQLIAADFECKKLGSFNLKGFSDKEDIYQLIRAADHSARRVSPGVPMIGRDQQRDQLYQAINGLAKGRGSLVLLSGDAGSGKTRFLAECKKGLEPDLLWLEGLSSSYDQRISYWPFIEILRRWLTQFWHDNDEWNWTLLVTCLDDLFGAEAEEIIPYVATLMGMDVPDPYSQRVRFLDRNLLGRQILRSMRRLFERTAAQRSVIIVIEDFHWADDSSVELVEHLLGLSLEARVLICLTTRPDGGQAARVLQATHRLSGLNVAEIDLPPLETAESIALLERLIGNNVQTKYLRDQILDRAGGNPFFIEEVVNSLIGSGALAPADKGGSWKVVGKEVSVPDTIHDVVMARVDRLDARLQHVLNVASVIGNNFLYTVLRAVTEHNDPLDEALGELGQRHFIDKAKELPELLYRFRHGLMQEAVYESMLAEKARALHERVADCLLAAVSGRTQAIAAVLAFHYARADQPEKALRYLLEAAEHSIKVAANAEALKYYEEALNTYDTGKAAPWETWQKAMIECRLGEIHFHRGNLGVANAHFIRALDACDDPLPRTRWGWRMALLRQMLVQILHRVHGVQRPSHERRLEKLEEMRLRIYEPYSWLLFFVDQEKMGYAILKSFNIAEARGWGEGIAKGSSGFGAALDLLGLHGWAHAYHKRALECGKAYGNPATQALAASLFGLHDAYIGQWDEALERFDTADALAVQTGDLLIARNCAAYRGTILIDRGALGEALAAGEKVVRHGREAAFDGGLRGGLVIVGAAMWRLGVLDRAQQVLEDSLKRSLGVGDNIIATHAWGELGLCLCAAGKFDVAATQLELAMLLIRRHKVRAFTVVAILLGLAQIEVARLESRDSRASARAAMRRCRDALGAARRFYFGLPRALRVMGTLQWLNGRHSAAQNWWDESLAVALTVGARYEAALTHAEIGMRQESADDAALGKQWLAECRANASCEIIDRA